MTYDYHDRSIGENGVNPDATLLFYKGFFMYTGLGSPHIMHSRNEGIKHFVHAASLGSSRAKMAIATWAFTTAQHNLNDTMRFDYRRRLAVELMAEASNEIIHRSSAMEIEGLPNTLRERERGFAPSRAEEINSEDQVDFERNLASHGDSNAQVDLGVRQMNARGVQRDVGAALENFRHAARAGNTAALFNLGFLYLTGTGVEADVNKAVQYFNQSAHGGNAAAYNGLGILYFTGDVFEKDYVKAREYFEKASNLGNNDSSYNLGLIHRFGLGTIVNHKIATNYFLQAFNGGHWKAANMVGKSYLHGQGVAMNLMEARNYFQTSVHDTAQWTDILNEATSHLDSGNLWKSLFRNLLLSIQGSKLGSINSAWILRKYKQQWMDRGIQQWKELASDRLDVASTLGSIEALIDLAMLQRSDFGNVLVSASNMATRALQSLQMSFHGDQPSSGETPSTTTTTTTTASSSSNSSSINDNENDHEDVNVDPKDDDAGLRVGEFVTHQSPTETVEGIAAHDENGYSSNNNNSTSSAESLSATDAILNTTTPFTVSNETTTPSTKLGNMHDTKGNINSTIGTISITGDMKARELLSHAAQEEDCEGMVEYGLFLLQFEDNLSKVSRGILKSAVSACADEGWWVALTALFAHDIFVTLQWLRSLLIRSQGLDLTTVLGTLLLCLIGVRYVYVNSRRWFHTQPVTRL